MKECRKCKELKTLDNFHNSSRTLDNKQPYCKTCNSVYGKKWFEENPRAKRDTRVWSLPRRYGITLEEYNKQLEKQNYSCAICTSKEPDGRGSFHTDHNHESKKLRGLLCHHCNLMLGNAKDNVETLLSAIKYIQNGGCYGQ